MSNFAVKFEPERKLLNPNFEGYKLYSATALDECEVSEIPLDSRALASCGMLDSTYELQLLAYKMSLNNLISNPFVNGQCFYFDIDHALWKADIGEEEDLQLIFDGVDETEKRFCPSLAMVKSDKLVCLYGACDSLKLIDLKDFDETNVSSRTSIYPLPENIVKSDFIRIEAAYLADHQQCHVAIVTITKSNSSQSTFQIHLLSLLPNCKLEQLAIYHGRTRPIFVNLDTSGLTIGSSQPFSTTDEEPLSANEPTTVNPSVKWEQDKENVYITLSYPTSIIESSVTINIDATVSMKQDDQILLFEMPYFAIDPVNSSCSINDSNISITLCKALKGQSWPFPWKEAGKPASDPLNEDADEATHSNRDIDRVIFAKYNFENLLKPTWYSQESSYIGPFVGLDRAMAVLSYGDDALAFTIKDRPIHSKTFDALSFVIASKQNRKFLVFSDQFALVIEASKNIFIYKTRSHDSQPRHLAQNLLSLNSNDQFLGWSIVHENLLVLLTENTLWTIAMNFSTN